MTKTRPPDPNDLHYTVGINIGLNNVERAAKYWLHEAHKSLMYELSEEVYNGEYVPESSKWKSKVHLRALELMEMDDDMRPAYRTKILQVIEDEALYHYAGYESSEEWFASEAGLKKSGQRSDYLWIAKTLIPFCKQTSILGNDSETDAFFFMPKNTDGSSRMAPMRAAITDLKDVVERNIYELNEDEQAVVVKNLLDNAADATKTPTEKKQYINQVREYLNGQHESKMEIKLYKNGDGRWHITDTHLTDHQLDRLKADLQWSAHIIFLGEEQPEVTEGISW